MADVSDQPGFSTTTENGVSPIDGLLANTSGANFSREYSEDDDFYRHSSTVTTIYCLACKSPHKLALHKRIMAIKKNSFD